MKKIYDEDGKATLLTHDYFMTEFHRFRAIMCSPDHSPDQKFDAYSGLLAVYLLCDDEEQELRESAIEILQIEFPMRMGLELTARLEDLFNELMTTR